MTSGNIQEKSFTFAVRIVNLYRYLTMEVEQKEFVLSKQLLRSGTAVGAMIREADYGESKADFIHKHAIAQKECNESLYWLELLHKTGYLSKKQYESLYEDCNELMKIITTIIKKSKNG